MSIEEKAKAYDEALKKIQSLYEQAKKDDNPIWSTYEHLFPQLRESEDERINRLIYCIVRDVSKAGEILRANGLSVDDALSYLEKQKEQKELPLMGGYADLYFDEWNQQKQNPTKRQCFEEGIRYARRLQKEQKPAEWSEKHIADVFEKVGLAKIVREQANDALTNAVQSAMIELSKAGNTEWSEEDEDMLNSCISSIEEAKENRYAYKETDGDTSYDHEIAWLKSLRPSWKPGEEQMEALERASTNKYLSAKQFDILVSLYEKLKKL